MLAARLGGDEFGILAHGCAVEALSAMAQDLIQGICCPVSLPNGEARTGVSIGMATYREGGAHSLDLLSQADRALYETKRSGRHRLCLYERLFDRRAEPSYPPVQVRLSA